MRNSQNTIECDTLTSVGVCWCEEDSLVPLWTCLPSSTVFIPIVAVSVSVSEHPASGDGTDVECIMSQQGTRALVSLYESCCMLYSAPCLSLGTLILTTVVMFSHHLVCSDAKPSLICW